MSFLVSRSSIRLKALGTLLLISALRARARGYKRQGKRAKAVFTPNAIGEVSL